MSGRQAGKAKPLKQPKAAPKDLSEEDSQRADHTSALTPTGAGIPRREEPFTRPFLSALRCSLSSVAFKNKQAADKKALAALKDKVQSKGSATEHIHVQCAHRCTCP